GERRRQGGRVLLEVGLLAQQLEEELEMDSEGGRGPRDDQLVDAVEVGRRGDDGGAPPPRRGGRGPRLFAWLAAGGTLLAAAGEGDQRGREEEGEGPGEAPAGFDHGWDRSASYPRAPEGSNRGQTGVKPVGAILDGGHGRFELLPPAPR